MRTNRANPSPYDLDAPAVAYGNSVPPPPPPMRCSQVKWLWFVSALMLCGAVALLTVTIITDANKNKLPRFQLDSVSVNQVNSTAVWDIGFSIDKPLGDLTVWVRFMGRDYKVDSVGTAGNTTVPVRTLLPRGLDYSSGGIITLEQVMFRCNNFRNYLFEAACKDVAVVGFSSKNETSTRGVMQGGPRLCPLVHKESSRQ